MDGHGECGESIADCGSSNGACQDRAEDPAGSDTDGYCDGNAESFGWTHVYLLCMSGDGADTAAVQDLLDHLLGDGLPDVEIICESLALVDMSRITSVVGIHMKGNADESTAFVWNLERGCTSSVPSCESQVVPSLFSGQRGTHCYVGDTQ